MTGSCNALEHHRSDMSPYGSDTPGGAADTLPDHAVTFGIVVHNFENGSVGPNSAPTAVARLQKEIGDDSDCEEVMNTIRLKRENGRVVVGAVGARTARK